MSNSRKGRRSSADKSPLLRRITYFVVMIMSGGGAGIGGWLCKDHPQLQPLVSLFLGKPGEAGGEVPQIKSALKTVIAGALSASASGPGVYKVTIDTVQLDPKAFTPGRTVDVQARVRKIDAGGSESVVWESKPFGENLAVVGRDELSAHWSNRPFEVEWRAGDRFMVEVWDRKAGLFSAQTFRMARRDVDVFPLATGEFALEPEGRVQPGTDPSRNRVVLASRRTGDSAVRPAQPPRGDAPAEVAERPLIIR
ncbi:hypothetical protein [Paludisphaera mucosa]|uniref:Uncharacterized protein n=1 Tax=Paludisphaera mucosa TaxID=3030827 RepID=A0ABT6FGP5_9BACT|nr:hypothetical protein [Paludisphaera mucosa]MDG3006753.1 hypothetical protein [Paludisphaera mucosa]